MRGKGAAKYLDCRIVGVENNDGSHLGLEC